jgi:predicted MFS family arabinose efflux permease
VQIVLRKGGLLALLLTLNVLNIVDRQLLPAMGPLIIQDLHISYAQFGWIVGPAFVVFFTLGSIFLGSLADCIQRPRLISAGLCVWSAMTVLTGAARSYAWMGLARTVVALGEATLAPSALSWLDSTFSARSRGSAIGIYYLAAPLGAGLALLISAAIAPAYGWRNCFYALGMAGLAAIPLLMLTRDARGPTSSDGRGTLLRKLLAMARVILRIRSLQLLLLVGVLTDFSIGSQALVTSWLVREKGADFRTIALDLGVVTVSGGVLGNLLGGLAADYLESKQPGGRVHFLCVMQLLLLPCALVVFLGPLSPGSVPFSCVYFAMLLVMTTKYAPVFSVVQELSPSGLKGTGVALSLAVMAICGTALGPVAAGLIGDRWSLARGLAVCAVLGSTSAGLCWYVARRYANDLRLSTSAE